MGGYVARAHAIGALFMHMVSTVADAKAVQGLLDHWRAALEQIGFHDPAAPKKLLPRLSRLLNRAQLTQEEVHILRGVAKAMQERCVPGS